MSVLFSAELKSSSRILLNTPSTPRQSHPRNTHTPSLITLALPSLFLCLLPGVHPQPLVHMQDGGWGGAWMYPCSHVSFLSRGDKRFNNHVCDYPPLRKHHHPSPFSWKLTLDLVPNQVTTKHRFLQSWTKDSFHPVSTNSTWGTSPHSRVQALREDAPLPMGGRQESDFSNKDGELFKVPVVVALQTSYQLSQKLVSPMCNVKVTDI